MPKVSVIVPIYNVEKYLRRCLDSILNQTIENIEVICIIDGSPDNCEAICREYSNLDKRIKVFTKENNGVSSARNLGLKIAKGKFLYFIDPDDHIELDMLYNMVDIAEQNKCDVIISGYKILPCKREVKPLYELNKKLNPLEMIKNNNLVHSNNDLCFSWRFLYRSEIIKKNNIKFNKDIKIGEDFIFNLEVLINSKSAYVTDKTDYYYTIDNSNSAMRTKYKSYLEKNLMLQYKIKRKLSEESRLYEVKHYRKDMANYYINNMLPLTFKNLFNGPEVNKNLGIKRILKYEMFRESFKEIGFNYKVNNYKEYIAYLILKFRVYPLAFKIINKHYKIN